MAREMKDSGVEWLREIPVNWQMIRNKNCFDCTKNIIGGKSSETQLLSLTTKGVKTKKAEESTGKIPESYDTYQTVEPDDIVMCLFDLDVSAVFSGISPYYGMISPAYKVLKCKDNIIPTFADFWFSYIFDGRKFKHYSKNLRYTLNYDEFAVLPIAVPSIHEQHRIASYLSIECEKIDAFIERSKASIEEYKKLKQAVITQAVTKGIRPGRQMMDCTIDGLDKMPADWIELRNSFLFRENVREPYENSPSLSLSQADGLVMTENMKESSLKTSSFDGWKRVELGDLVLNRFKAHLGVFFAATIKGMVSFHYGVYSPVRAVNSKYYEYLFHSDVYRGIFAYKSNGMTVGLQNLSNQNFYDVKSLYPSIEEQNEIVEYIDSTVGEIDKLIKRKEIFIDELESYKKSLIYEYVTGKKEVPA